MQSRPGSLIEDTESVVYIISWPHTGQVYLQTPGDRSIPAGGLCSGEEQEVVGSFGVVI
jgi:8-oxo-dGTP pyrophosphatase MutT (NUDIX family)